MKFSRLRILLTTFCFALAVVSMIARINGYLDKSPVKVYPVKSGIPEIQSDAPVIIRVCPQLLSPQERKERQKNGGYAGGGQSAFTDMCFSRGGGG